MLRGTLYKLGLPKFPKPAGTIEEFRNWEKKLKTKYPTRYAIGEAIERFFGPFRVAKRKCKTAYWALQHRFNPKHRYHIVNTKLPPGYHEVETRMFYAMFQLFAEFMEFQLKTPHVVWEYDKSAFEDWMIEDDLEGVEKEIESRNKMWKEMNDLYTWWTVTYPKLEKDFDESSFTIEAEEEFEKEVEEMMIRLVKIRRTLWD